MKASIATKSVKDSRLGDAQRPLLAFDDTCAFCRRGVGRLVRLSGNRVDARPSAEVLGPDANPGEIKLLLPDGRVLGGADGIFHALAQAPIWRPVAFLAMLPGVRLIPRAAYRWIAARRHRLGRTCVDDACEIRTGDATATDRQSTD